MRDFPSSRLPVSLQVLQPAQFLADHVSLDPDLTRLALEKMGQRRKTDALSLAHELVRRYGLGEALGHVYPEELPNE
ncbi:hypothetical protein GCM10028789_29480 [Sinomonas halotolerans]